MRRQMLWSALVALLVSILTIGTYHLFINAEGGQKVRVEHVNGTPSKSALYTLDAQGNPVPLDFTKTAEQVMNAVVHIRSTRNAAEGASADPFAQAPDIFDFFFGPERGMPGPEGRQPSVGEGSGVIISADGYIVTNNHVIAEADDLEVTFHDNRSYKARLIGTDPNTDLAVIKVEEKNLPFLTFSDSDKVRVGEWVMAVGNPFNLNSTVTAGIVSAKARNINILREQYAVESFIQTDAAINPGNSGGALVDLQGSLIGINTAIASPTGAYSGYGFAVPSNIVRKVIDDLIEFKTVQRGYLGISIRTVDAALAREKSLKVIKGVYVDQVGEESAAGKGGVKPGDVITAIDGQAINSTPELQEMIARRRPGDKVKLSVDRKGAAKSFTVVLKNQRGNTDLLAKAGDDTLLEDLGITVEPVHSAKARELNIDGGLKVTKLGNGIIREQTQMREGFIITKVDGVKVGEVEALIKVLNGKRGGVMLEGVYEGKAGVYYYAFGLS